jgi:hypothetical protein
VPVTDDVLCGFVLLPPNNTPNGEFCDPASNTCSVQCM